MPLQICLDCLVDSYYIFIMKNGPLFIPRAINPFLQKLLEDYAVIAVVGPRQSGKSTLLQTSLGEKYRSISFDDPSRLQ